MEQENPGSQVCNQAPSLVLRSPCFGVARSWLTVVSFLVLVVICYICISAFPHVTVGESQFSLTREGWVPVHLSARCTVFIYTGPAFPCPILDCFCHLALKTLLWEVCLPRREGRGMWSYDGAIPTPLPALAHLAEEAQVGCVPQATAWTAYSSSSFSRTPAAYLLTEDSIRDGNQMIMLLGDNIKIHLICQKASRSCANLLTRNHLTTIHSISQHQGFEVVPIDLKIVPLGSQDTG